MTLRQTVRLAAVGSWAVITVLSLVPGEDRPHTGMSGNLEHATAYCIAAGLTRSGFTRIQTRWQLAAFSSAAAVFEICQIWIPGRSAGIDNWAASTAGALSGLIVARAIAHRYQARKWRRQAGTARNALRQS